MPKNVRKEIARLAGKTLTREARIAEVRAEDDAREITLAFSSEAPVERWFGLEVLRHDNGAADFSRLESGTAGLMFAHGRDPNFGVMPVGRVVEAWVDDDLVGRARVVFDDDEKSEQVWKKVKSGTLQGVSFGYTWGSHSYEFVQKGDVSSDGRFGPFDDDAVVVKKWEVLEISLEPVPADAGVGVGRAFDDMEPAVEETVERNEGGEETLENAVERTEIEQVKEPEVPAIDVEQELAAAIEAERVRVAEINAIADKFSVEADERNAWIAGGHTVEAVRKVVLDKQANEREAMKAVEVKIEEKDKYRNALTGALMSRVGFLSTKMGDVERSSGYEDFAGYSLVELARDCVRRAGMKATGHPNDIVARAMATDDFPYVLGNIANKSVLAGWESANETWPLVFNTGQVNNFHIHTAARAGELDDLDEIKESAEYKYGETSEQFEQYQVATYGKLFAVTRQMIVNDDIGQIAELPMKRGEAAARKVGDVAWAQITSNPVMGDTVTLFHASSHKNYVASGAAPSVATIGKGIEMMKLQKDISGKRRLNISPAFFVAPVTLEAAAEQFFNTVLIGGASDQPNLANPYSSKFTRVYEPRLDDDSPTAWYLFGPKGKTVTVFFLNGVQAPYLETKQGWNVDGVEYKVRIDVGAKAMDWRGVFKNNGTT